MPLSPALTFLLVSLEVKPPEGLVSTTSATKSWLSVFMLLLIKVMEQKLLFPSHQNSVVSCGTEQ